VDRHAGRLRADLAGRVRESVHEYERELTSVVREAIASVEASIERAGDDVRSGRITVATRLDELRQLERRVGELHAELADAPAAPRSSVRPESPERQHESKGEFR
jgi:hypothetical protein